MRRRKFLVATGAATTTLMAGCTSEDDDDDTTGEAEAAEEEESDESDEAEDGDEEENGEDEDDEDDEDNEEDEEDVDPDDALEDDDIESTVEGLEILEHELVEDDFGVSVEGVVANNTGDELSYVEVGAVFYNSDGQRIGDSFTNTTDLPDGQEWVFEILTTEDAEDIDDYSIAVTDSPF